MTTQLQNFQMRLSMNFESTSLADAKVSVLDRSFLYGDSIYEVVRTYEGKLFTLKEHFERLERSAQRIYMRLPFGYEKLRDHLKEMVKAVGSPNCYLRIVVSRGITADDGTISIEPPKPERPLTVVIAKPLKDWPKEDYSRGVRLMTPTIRRNPRAAMDPGIKSGNYLNNVLALYEARRQGVDDAVMLNPSGHITESTLSNVFFVKDGVVLNPASESSILDGITRAIVMQICEKNEIPINTGLFTLEDVRGAQECFISSTSREVMPVRQLNETTYRTDGPVTARLGELYKAYVKQRLAQDDA